MTWRGARVLVTGAAGFLGSHLVRALAARAASVYALVRPGADLWRLPEDASILVRAGDLADERVVAGVVEEARPDVVVHAAAAGGHPRTADERAKALRDTVLGTAHLLEALRTRPPARLVYVGSSLAIGPKAGPLREDDAPAPAAFRGAVKAAAEILALQMGREAGVGVASVRPFSTYGPFEQPGRFIPTVVRAVLRGEPVALTGPGTRHDFVYVDDVVEACLRAAERPEAAGRVFHAGTGSEWTNEAVVELAQAVGGRRVPVHAGAHAAHPVDTVHWCADITASREILGWSPAHDLRAGLEKTFAWHRARGEGGR